MLPGDSGTPSFSRRLGGRQGTLTYPPASRVSISELFGIAHAPHWLASPSVYPDFLLESVAEPIALHFQFIVSLEA